MALALSLFLNKLNPNSTKWYRLKEPSGSSSESEWEAYRFSVGQLMLCLYPEMLKKQRGEGEATPSATPSTKTSHLLRTVDRPSIAILCKMMLDDSSSQYDQISELVRDRSGLSKHGAMDGEDPCPIKDLLMSDLYHRQWEGEQARRLLSSWEGTRFAFVLKDEFRGDFNAALEEDRLGDGWLLSDREAFWNGVDIIIQGFAWDSADLDQILYAEQSLFYSFVMAGLQGARDYAIDLGFTIGTGAPKKVGSERINIGILTAVRYNGRRFEVDTDVLGSPVKSDTRIRIGTSRDWCGNGLGLVSNASEVSGRHFEVRRDGDDWYLRDEGTTGVGSTNATLLVRNGVLIWCRGLNAYLLNKQGEWKRLPASYLPIKLYSGDIIVAAPLVYVCGSLVPGDRGFPRDGVRYEPNTNRSGVCFRFETQTGRSL